MENIKVIILAAGKGTRINDSEHPMPKVLREAHGRPLLSYVIDSTELLGIKPEDITIVVGFMKEMIIDRFKDSGCGFAVQDDGGYFITGVFEFLFGLGERFRVHIRQHDMRAMFGKRSRAAFTVAHRGAGDECYFAI